MKVRINCAKTLGIALSLLVTACLSAKPHTQKASAASPVKQTKAPATAAAATAAAAAPSTPSVEGAWEKLSDGSMGQTTEFDGAGGIKIAAYVRKPVGSGPFPVVVMIHGADASKNGTYGLGRRMASPTGDFVAAGWAIYSIDFRPKDAIPAPGTAPEGSDPLVQDAINAVAKARTYSFVDPKRVAIMGGSRGGQLMARIATRVDISGGVLCAPAGLDMIELSKVIQTGKKINPVLKSMVKARERRLGASMAEVEKNPAKYHYSSPITEASKVRFPLMLISGCNDESSPIPVLDAFAKKLRESGKEVETYFPVNGPHGFYYGMPHDIPETKEAAKHAVAFLRKCFDDQPVKQQG
jgi:dipeptidyl aminopeptidase/acylaminoacyl peptidase